MTPRTQNVLTWFSLAAVATLFGAGAAWGVTSYRLSTLEAQVARIDTRVGRIYCAQVPASMKDACQ